MGEIWLIRDVTRSTLLVSELLRESTEPEETSLFGDGGMLWLLLEYGSAGCIIAPDGGMASDL